MPKRCPPGVICIENVTIVLIIIVLSIAAYYYSTKISNISNVSKSETTRELVINEVDRPLGLFSRPNYSYSNVPNDILLNPYTPPYRDDRVFPFNLDPRGAIPINISTSAVDTTYRQVGILKRVNGPEMILPLMGRPLFTNRDKWQFYTLNENNIKLPVTFKQKSCTSEYGCDNVYTGDSVYVDGIDAVFKATMYDSAVYKYLPFV
jgi:hypothetical protein